MFCKFSMGFKGQRTQKALFGIAGTLLMGEPTHPDTSKSNTWVSERVVV